MYALIADDLTGALDAGAGFARASLRCVLPLAAGDAAAAQHADVLLLNTESREGNEAAARAAARNAATRARAVGAERVYKKIDSVLRGHPGVELTAVLDVFGGRAVVAPAFPAQGRTTVDGIQRAHDRPVGPYGGDLRLALQAAADRCTFHDAASDDDLARIAHEAALDAESRVWCGSAGLAAHVPAALGLHPTTSPAPLPKAERVVVIAGSQHPQTRAQVQALQAAGWHHVALDPRQTPAAKENADQLAALASLTNGGRPLAISLHRAPTDLLEEEDQQRRRQFAQNAKALLEGAARALPVEEGLGLILTGGETALIVCRALGGRAIEVVGEALPGLPLGILERQGKRIGIATKSGGFGEPDALLVTAAALCR